MQDEILALLMSVCPDSLPVKESLDLTCGIVSLINACLIQRQVGHCP